MAITVGVFSASCSAESGPENNEIAVQTSATTEAEPTPTSIGLDLDGTDERESTAPLSMALVAPTRAPTPTPTPRPTPVATETADPSPGDSSDNANPANADSPQSGSAASAANSTAPAPSASGGAHSGAGGGTSLSPTPPASSTPQATEPALSDPTPIDDTASSGDNTATSGDNTATSGDIVAHRGGVGSYRWGDSAEEVAGYVTEQLGHQPTIIEAVDSTTGRRQLTWPGFMIDADPSGAMVQWYWYPSFADGVVVDELGPYQTGLSFARRPNGIQVQTIGPEPNLWWVGTNLTVRYAWDALAAPPPTASEVVGAVIYVSASQTAPITAGEPGTVPPGTEILMSPNGARLYTLEDATPVVIYRVETHHEQDWALVVPSGGDWITGYMVWPPANS